MTIFSPRVEMKFAIAEMNRLIAFAEQMHLDAAGFGVVDGAMSPMIQVEIRAELAVRRASGD